MLFLWFRSAFLSGLLLLLTCPCYATEGAAKAAASPALLSTHSDLGFSVDHKPGQQLMSGSFVSLGVAVRLSERSSLGLITLADGGKSPTYDNYRLASMLSYSYALGIIADQLTVAFGPYTETILANQPQPSSIQKRRERGLMGMIRLTRELYRQKGFAVDASTILGFYRSNGDSLGRSSLGSGAGRSQGVSIGARFML